MKNEMEKGAETIQLLRSLAMMMLSRLTDDSDEAEITAVTREVPGHIMFSLMTMLFGGLVMNMPINEVVVDDDGMPCDVGQVDEVERRIEILLSLAVEGATEGISRATADEMGFFRED